MTKNGLCEPSEKDSYRRNPAAEVEVPDPVALLMERLLLGGDPDERFHDDVERCAAFFNDNPIARMMYIVPLKKSAGEAILADPMDPYLWRLAEPRLKQPTPTTAPRVDESKEIARLEQAIEMLKDRVDALEDLLSRDPQARVQASGKATTKSVLKTVVTRSGVTHKKRG